MTPQSHIKSLQNWSPKPSLLQSTDVLDNPILSIRNGPQAALHRLQKPFENRYQLHLKLLLLSQTSKHTISIPKATNLVPKRFQLGPNMASFWSGLGVYTRQTSTLASNFPAKTSRTSKNDLPKAPKQPDRPRKRIKISTKRCIIKPRLQPTCHQCTTRGRRQKRSL